MLTVLVVLLLQVLAPANAHSCTDMELLAGRWTLSGIAGIGDYWEPTVLDLEIEFGSSGTIYFYRTGQLEYESSFVLSCRKLELLDVVPSSDYGPIGRPECGLSSVWLFDQEWASETYPCEGDLCAAFSNGDECTDSPHWLYERSSSVAAGSGSWGSLKARF